MFEQCSVYNVDLMRRTLFSLCCVTSAHFIDQLLHMDGQLDEASSKRAITDPLGGHH